MNSPRRSLPLWVLACTLAVSAVASAQDSTLTVQERRSFLQPPTKEALQRGLQPLSATLPDTKLRSGVKPPDVSLEVFDATPVPLPIDRGPTWSPIDYCWTASNLRHRPLYFEDVMLERHGQTWHPLVQPLASGTRFFLTFPVLPYAMTINPPRPAYTTLGHFRPGSGAPLLLQRPPLQADASIVEAGAWVGLIFLLP